MKESNAPAVGRTPFQKWLDKYQGLFYLIPWIIGFVVFKAVPFGQSLYYSFTDMNFFKSGTQFVGLANYITAFTTTKITKALLKKHIFGGKDLSSDFPALGQCAMYCVTEVHTKEDIDTLVSALNEILG